MSKSGKHKPKISDELTRSAIDGQHSGTESSLSSFATDVTTIHFIAKPPKPPKPKKQRPVLTESDWSELHGGSSEWTDVQSNAGSDARSMENKQYRNQKGHNRLSEKMYIQKKYNARYIRRVLKSMILHCFVGCSVLLALIVAIKFYFRI